MDYSSIRQYLGSDEILKSRTKKYDTAKLAKNLFSLDGSVEDFLNRFQAPISKKTKDSDTLVEVKKVKKNKKIKNQENQIEYEEVMPAEEELEEVGAYEDSLDQVLEEISKIKSMKSYKK